MTTPPPTRTLTDADVAAIAEAIKTPDDHCRYSVDPEDLAEAVKFFKNFNKALEDSKRTIWRTVLVLLITGFVSLLTLGLWNKSQGG